MAAPLTLSEIPTITLLYKLRKIALPANLEASDLPSPSAEYNDKISIIRHDITQLAVDSIVNAANESLLGGGGVDGAIHRAAGPELLEECETLNGCPTGSARITDGYQLPAKKVIHAVGPIYWMTKPQRRHTGLLHGCYRTSLELAVQNGLKSIAFSALSTGVYGYPSGEASTVALNAVREFLDEGKGDSLERIIFCNFMQKDEDAYFHNIPKFFPPVTEQAEKKDEATAEDSEQAQLAAKLPDTPKTDPKAPDEPSSKRQKTSSQEQTADEAKTTEDEWEIVNHEK
jgi:O-acetyl-ADP-ribose deacetylase (regulator of RNase III)